MNPFVCASFAFLLTVSQAVAVAAEGERSKSTSKKSIPLIVGIIVAVVVVLIIAALIILIRKRSRKSKRMSAPVQPQNAPHLNRGQAAGYGKDGYSPYILTLPTPPSFTLAEWRADALPPQFNSTPSFPGPHAPTHA